MLSRKGLLAPVFFLAIIAFPWSLLGTPPQLSLVLSGGGARGAAHVGVIKRLEEEGIPIDLIVGTSFGSLVGGLYAAGYSTADLELTFQRIDWDWIFDESPDRRHLNVDGKTRHDRSLFTLDFDGTEPQLPTGLQTGQKVVQLLDRLTLTPLFEAGSDFSRLPIPFRAVATDLLLGKPYIFRQGSLSRAIRASIGVPGVFTPVEEGEMLLVDGGVSSNMPVAEARAEGATLVLAVDVSTPLKTDKREIRSLVDVLDQTISLHIEEAMTKSREAADLVLTPDLSDFSSADFAKMPQMVERGYQATDARIAEICAWLDRQGVRRVYRPRRNRLNPSFDGSSVPSDVEFEVGEVTVSGVDSHTRQIRRQAPAVGPARPSKIDGAASRIYALSRIDQVTYRLEGRPDSSRLTYDVHEVPRGQLGLGIRYDPDYQFTGAIEFLARDFLNQGTELSLRSLLGNAKLGEVRLRYPIVGETFFEPLFHYQRQPRFFPGEVEGEELRVPFQEDRLTLWLGLGTRLGRSVLVRAGYELEKVNLEQTLGRSAFWNAGFRFEGFFDNRDSAAFPSSGSRLSASLRFVEDQFGGDSTYQRYQAQAETFFKVGARNTIGLSGSWGVLQGDNPAVDGFFSGGAGYLSLASDPFPGLERDAILSQQAAQLGVDYRYLLSDLSLSFVDRVYLGIRYRAGLFSRPDSNDQFRSVLHGVAGGIFFQTRFLGPVSFQVSGTNAGNYATYLSLGYFF